VPDPSLTIDADRTRLAQAFVNLLHNAAKYTDPGGRIEVGVIVEKGQATVQVRDNGIGIPPDHLDKVFDMFSQVESALSRSRGGLGIGLSLTQRLVQMHGGSVKAYSDGLGKGSRFHVQLPLVAQANVPAQAAPRDADRKPARLQRNGLSILVADDNVDAAETLAALLELMGHTVVQANDGEQAVAMTTEVQPQIAILDIGMPRLNGYEACRRIRAQMDPPPLMVALTGWGQEKDIAQSQAAGFARHLVKPVNADALEALLAEVRKAPATPMPGKRDSG
jgi:CheY-like chemotaxis protein